MPSAGRAFTPEMITELISRGIDVAPITLHAGVASLEDHEVLLRNLYGTEPYTGDFHMFGFTEVVLRHYLALSGLEVVELVHKDEWIFDATAVKVSGEPRLDLSELPFMSLALPGDPTPPPGRRSVPPEARERWTAFSTARSSSSRSK